MIVRIFLFDRLLIHRTIFCSHAPFSHRGFYSRFIADPSFFQAKRLSSLSVGDSKLAKPKCLSSIFLNPSTDSIKKVTPRPNRHNAKKGKREMNKLPQTNISSMFCHMKEKEFPNELSPEVESLLRILTEELHLNLELELGQIPMNFPARYLLKSAAEKLGQRHQKIAKWLSGSDLKKLALFGCPSVEKKTVFASKRLRSFFCIEEDIVCRGCKIKASCNFVNQRVNKVDRVILADVMRLLTVLSLDAVPRQLLVPIDMKLSVDKLLKEAVNLSQLQF